MGAITKMISAGVKANRAARTKSIVKGNDRLLELKRELREATSDSSKAVLTQQIKKIEEGLKVQKGAVLRKKPNIEARLINDIARYKKELAKPGKAFQKSVMSKAALKERLAIAEQRLKTFKGKGTLVKKDYAKPTTGKTGKAKGAVRKDFMSTLGAKPKQATKRTGKTYDLISRVKKESAVEKVRIDKFTGKK